MVVHLNARKRAGGGNINISYPVLKSEAPFWIKKKINLSDEQMFKCWSYTVVRRRFNELLEVVFQLV